MMPRLHLHSYLLACYCRRMGSSDLVKYAACAACGMVFGIAAEKGRGMRIQFVAVACIRETWNPPFDVATSCVLPS